jgi:alkanesulfonate monooxygenase SsuD/methylene tetrahydromethanopterin reductase-like flavin-dependent oxidoreductase (luciferase family)
VQKPFPIWIGGASDAALRRVARFGTGWTPSSLTPAEQGERLPRLRQLLEEHGRSLAEIRIAGSKVGNGWAGGKPPDPEAVLEQVRQWAQIGVDSVAVNLGGLATPAATLVERMQWFAENVMPRAAKQ